MAIIKIYAEDNDGYIKARSTVSFQNARAASSGYYINDTSATHNEGFSMAATLYKRGGTAGNTFFGRTFIAFDVSSITSTHASATLTLYGFANQTIAQGGFAIVKSTAFGTGGVNGTTPGQDLILSDFDKITGSGGLATSSMAGQSSVVKYSTYSSSNFSSNWLTGTVGNVFTLNTQALTDIGNNDWLVICLVNYSYDYLYNAPVAPIPGTIPPGWTNSLTEAHGGTFADSSTVTLRPHLSITTISTGYDHAVNTVTSANIGKVNTTATANIGKIITV